MVKYNTEVFDDETLIESLKENFEQASKKFDVNIIDQDIGINYAHILISTKPTLDIPLYLSALKGHSSRHLRSQFVQIKDRIKGDNFWEDYYLIATTGNMTPDFIMGYIQSRRDCGNA
jgi:putative transposase